MREREILMTGVGGIGKVSNTSIEVMIWAICSFQFVTAKGPVKRGVLPFFFLVFKTESGGYLSVGVDGSFHVEVLQRGRPKYGIFCQRILHRGCPESQGSLNISRGNTSEGFVPKVGVL